MKLIKRAGLRYLLPLLASLGTARAAITLQFVNDSGLPDSQVYALLLGVPVNTNTPINVAGIRVADGSKFNDPPVTSQAINTLPSAGFSVNSRFSGRTLPVYECSVGSIASGAMLFSYQSSFSYSNANPSPITANFRFDQLEFTYDPGIPSVANLTSIDAYAIPLQLETMSGSGANTTLIDTRTYYASTESLLSEFSALGAAAAFRGRNADASGQPVSWSPADGMSNFVRILGPGKLASDNLPGSPAPYPSFGAYLASLAATNYTFTCSGNANGSAYAYSGVVVSDGNGGYQINLTGTTAPPPPSPIPGDAAVTIHLPNGNASGAVQTINYDTFIYGAVLNGDAFSVAGMTKADIEKDSNIVYGAIVRDVLSGLNFGYLQGRYGNASSSWYGVPPTRYPFGRGRTQNDGFYNPWAAVIYNNSDAYGFAFSDRSGPSPAIVLNDRPILRVTILPDHRLDTPKVAVDSTGDSSISLSWPEVTGATGYVVTVTLPSPRITSTLSALPGTNTHVITGLKPGTPYTFTVTSLGTANGQVVESPARPQQAMTTGTLVPANNPGGIRFFVGFSWIDNVPAGATVAINGQVLPYIPSNGVWLANNLNAQLSATNGHNEYVLTLQDPAQGIIFANILSADFGGVPTSYDVTNGLLAGNEQPLSAAPSTPPYLDNQLVLGVPFTPIPLKAFAPVLFPGTTYNTWIRDFPGLASLDPSADPDGDGDGNLQEFFQGSHPDQAADKGTLTLGLEPAVALLRYDQQKDISGVVEKVSWSTDLVHWSTDGVTYAPDIDQGATLLRTARVPRSGQSRLYLRLTIELTRP